MPIADPTVRRAKQRQCMRSLRARRDPVPWIEASLTVPSGPLAGRPFRLGRWQRAWLRAAMAPGVREAGLSVGRKNGKSGLVAAALAAFLVGELGWSGWRGVVTSVTGRLAKELRLAVAATLRASGITGWREYRAPAPGRIEAAGDRVVEMLAADKATGHAVGADLAVIDEAGLLGENQRGLWNAMLSSTSGRDGKLWAISIQGDGPMFRELKERGESGDPAVHWTGYCNPADVDPLDEAAWHRANPGLRDGVKSLEYMRDLARRAVTVPADLAHFRAYDLNAPQSPDRVPLVDVNQWTALVVDEAPPRRGWCVVGVDLGGSASMCAAWVTWPKTGRVECYAALPGVPDLEKRGTADGVGTRYLTMRDRGELQVYPGVRTTPVALFLADLVERLQGQDVRGVVADRYRESEARDAYQAAAVRWRQVYRGQGWRDAAEDVRAFQRAVIDKRWSVEESLLIESAIAESALATDEAGNAKLDRARARGRIDAVAAGVLSAGECERVARLESAGRRRVRYHGAV